MNNIKIEISGEPNSGKTGLVFILKEFFREKNFEVNVQSNHNYNSDEQLNNLMGRNNKDEIADFVKLKSKITIVEKH